MQSPGELGGWQLSGLVTHSRVDEIHCAQHVLEIRKPDVSRWHRKVPSCSACTSKVVIVRVPEDKYYEQ